MTLSLRTFQIRDGQVAEDERAVANFLQTVQTERIDSTYAPGGWRLLVLFRDPKSTEESAQIASVIAAALKRWRAETAGRMGVDPSSILTDEAVSRAAQYVPTTSLELRVTLGVDEGNFSPFESEIVQVVRRTLDELS